MNKEEPISWQIKLTDIMIAVDWKDISSMQKLNISQHFSYTSIIEEKRQDISNLK